MDGKENGLQRCKSVVQEVYIISYNYTVDVQSMVFMSNTMTLWGQSDMWTVRNNISVSHS